MKENLARRVLKLTKEVFLFCDPEHGDTVASGKAYGSLGSTYLSQGEIGKAIEYHAQDLAIAKVGGDRAGEGMADGKGGRGAPENNFE